MKSRDVFLGAAAVAALLLSSVATPAAVAVPAARQVIHTAALACKDGSPYLFAAISSPDGSGSEVDLLVGTGTLAERGPVILKYTFVVRDAQPVLVRVPAPVGEPLTIDTTAWIGYDGYELPAVTCGAAGAVLPQEFSDVPVGTQFFAEMGWLGAMGISNGWDLGDGTREYRPLVSVNRDAMAAFMYRLAGQPAFTPPAVSPFVDVTTDNQFYTEITWLNARGISTGWDRGDGTREFRPVTPVNRDAMAAFMYRFAGEPAFTAPAGSPFVDVATDNQFYREISWLAESGISTGWDDGTFRPVQPVARDAMAAFMLRFANLTAARLEAPGTLHLD